MKEIHALSSEIIATQTDGRTTDKLRFHKLCWHSQAELKIKLVSKTTGKKLFLKCQDKARFSSLSLASENVFLSYFLLKKTNKKKPRCNSEGNYLFRKKITLILKTTYKKLVLKHQDNARFPSFFVCLASKNACLRYFYSENDHD